VGVDDDVDVFFVDVCFDLVGFFVVLEV